MDGPLNEIPVGSTAGILHDVTPLLHIQSMGTVKGELDQSVAKTIQSNERAGCTLIRDIISVLIKFLIV